MSHIVTSALVIAKKEDGSDLYLYEGSQLPSHLSDADVKRLVDLGLVDKVDGRSAKPVAPIAESN